MTVAQWTMLAMAIIAWIAGLGERDIGHATIISHIWWAALALSFV